MYLSGEDAVVGGAVQVGDKGVSGTFLCSMINVAVNIKLLSKIKSIDEIEMDKYI